MPKDLTYHIVAQLEARGIRIEGADTDGPNLKAYCFAGHDVKSASLSIRKLDGAFYCFGCGVRGKNWNALAAHIDGDVLKPEDMPDQFSIIHTALTRQIHDGNAPAELPWNLEPWTLGAYRGLSTGFLERVQAHRWYDDAVRVYRIFFPIHMRNKLKGWVARRLDKDDTMKYRNAPSMKSTEILYPYDFIGRHFDCRTVVLVEGPMDALRLCHFRIPSLAIMGTNNWRPQKRSMLMGLGVERVIICTDADRAGRECRYDVLEPGLQDWFDVEHFHPPDGDDPGGMHRRQVMRLKTML